MFKVSGHRTSLKCLARSGDTGVEHRALRGSLDLVNSTAEGGMSSFVQVPFEEVLELVANRKIYLQQGHAFVPRDQVLQLIYSQSIPYRSDVIIACFRAFT